MKYLTLALIAMMTFSGCLGPRDNPDENFGEFYEGSPDDFQLDDSGFPDSLEDDRDTLNTEETLIFTGGNENWQCTTTCLPISE